jgi:hypothetical protein
MAKLDLHQEYRPFTQDCVWRLISNAITPVDKLDDARIAELCEIAFKAARIYFPLWENERAKLQALADEEERLFNEARAAAKAAATTPAATPAPNAAVPASKAPATPAKRQQLPSRPAPAKAPAKAMRSRAMGRKTR